MPSTVGDLSGCDDTLGPQVALGSGRGARYRWPHQRGWTWSDCSSALRVDRNGFDAQLAASSRMMRRAISPRLAIRIFFQHDVKGRLRGAKKEGKWRVRADQVILKRFWPYSTLSPFFTRTSTRRPPRFRFDFIHHLHGFHNTDDGLRTHGISSLHKGWGSQARGRVKGAGPWVDLIYRPSSFSGAGAAGGGGNGGRRCGRGRPRGGR